MNRDIFQNHLDQELIRFALEHDGEFSIPAVSLRIAINKGDVHLPGIGCVTRELAILEILELKTQLVDDKQVKEQSTHSPSLTVDDFFNATFPSFLTVEQCQESEIRSELLSKYRDAFSDLTRRIERALVKKEKFVELFSTEPSDNIFSIGARDFLVRKLNSYCKPLGLSLIAMGSSDSDKIQIGLYISNKFNYKAFTKTDLSTWTDIDF